MCLQDSEVCFDVTCDIPFSPKKEGEGPQNVFNGTSPPLCGTLKERQFERKLNDSKKQLLSNLYHNLHSLHTIYTHFKAF